MQPKEQLPAHMWSLISVVPALIPLSGEQFVTWMYNRNKLFPLQAALGHGVAS